MPRLATSADLDAVLRLAAEKDYPVWPSQDPGSNLLKSLRDSFDCLPEVELSVLEKDKKVSGFLLLKKELVRGITGDRETVIADSFAAQTCDLKWLLRHAAARARTFNTSYLTIEISPADATLRGLLESEGFRLESHRISVATALERIPEASPYSVRPVTVDDAFMIGVLNSTMLDHTLSAGRDYKMGEVSFASMQATIDFVNRQDSNSAGLALTLDHRMVGHLLLHLTDRFGYIYDLALEREHWGGIAVRHLMRAGSRLLYARGLPLFVGDVSASNRRALVVAQRALGFTVEWQRWGLKL